MNNNIDTTTEDKETRRPTPRRWKAGAAIATGCLVAATAFALVGGESREVNNPYAGCERSRTAADRRLTEPASPQRARPAQVFLCRD